MTEEERFTQRQLVRILSALEKLKTDKPWSFRKRQGSCKRATRPAVHTWATEALSLNERREGEVMRAQMKTKVNKSTIIIRATASEPALWLKFKILLTSKQDLDAVHYHHKDVH
jgi:hypothetical protein